MLGHDLSAERGRWNEAIRWRADGPSTQVRVVRSEQDRS